MSALNNPRYLQKLGIVRNMISQQEAAAGEGATRDQIVVDEVCKKVRDGCTLREFKKWCEELYFQEEVKGEGADQEINNEFYSIIGSQGWGLLHAACSSNNTEIVEYIINKK